MHTDADVRLERVVRRQHGAFNRVQARAAGFSERQIDYRIARGSWRRLDAEVYAHSAFPPTWEQRCSAALLRHDRAVLSGTAAAAVHRLRDFRRGAIEVSVPRSDGRRSNIARLRHTDLIQPRVVDGLRVNSIPLVVIELAARVSFERLDRAFEGAVLDHRVTVEGLASWFVRLERSRRGGLGSVRRILESRATGWVPPESDLERLLRRATDDPRIPPTTWQAPFPWCPHDGRRLDGFVEEWGVLLEADGRLWHARLATMDEDRRRDREAVRRGYLPMRFGWYELHDDLVRCREEIVEAGRTNATERCCA